MKPITFISPFVITLTALSSSAALAHSNKDQFQTPSTKVTAAISATWRDQGVAESDTLWQIPGLLMGGEAYPVTESTSLDDASISVHHRTNQGSHGMIQIASHDNGNEAEIHHAFAGHTLTQDNSQWRIEAGRMAAAMTPLNGEHSHHRLASEAPLIMDGFLGRQLNDEGIRLQWLAQSWVLGLESWRGSAFPATSGEDGGSYDIYLQYRAEHWQAGVWWLEADANNRSDSRYSSGHSHGDSADIVAPEIWFDGQTQIAGAFFRSQWQLTNHLQWRTQGDMMAVQVEGNLRDSSRQAALSSEYNGGYLQTSLRWQTHEVGIGWERLSLDNELVGAAAGVLATTAGVYTDHSPSRTTLVYSWQAAPGLRLRAEWVQDNSLADSVNRFGLGLVWQQALWSNE